MTKPGHPQPVGDNRNELSLFSSVTIPEVSPEPLTAEILESQIPHAAKRLVGIERTEDERRWDHSDDSGYPKNAEQTRQDVGRTMLTADDIERAEIAEIRRGYKPTKRPKKDRRHLGPNQKNTADGDKRVEAIYGKPGEIL